MALALVMAALIGSLTTLVLTGTTPTRAAAAPKAHRFLPGLQGVPKSVHRVQEHVQAVRRKHDPKPKTRSRATISLYERTTAPVVLRRQGCSAADRGATGVVILDFGKQSYNGHTYGTILFWGAFAGNDKITRAMLAYARGYVRCLSPGSPDRIQLARGTSNYHPSVPSTYKAGRKWLAR